MNTWLKTIPIVLGIGSWVLATAWGEPTDRPEAAAAIQAIQQASDPSAAVAAFANGMAADRNDFKLFEAYVARMVDLGLPELAYHQAQTLTSLDSKDGLAWGVVAYTEARRGNMAEAISAITLASQFASDNPLVERTAGELVAWYDVKADQSKLPDNAKEGLAQVRELLSNHTVFASAYDTAKKAYQTPTAATPIPGQAPSAPAQSQYQGQPYQAGPYGETATAAPLPYSYPAPYPDYYYAAGPGWVAPAPWWWWHPVGFFAGFDFFPFHSVLLFDHRDFFFHDRFFDPFVFHDRFFFHDRLFHHNGFSFAFHDLNHFFVHGKGLSFFASTAQPRSSLGLSLRANFNSAPAFSSSRFGVRSTTGSFLVDPPAMRSSMGSLTPLRPSALSSRSVMLRPSTMNDGRRNFMSSARSSVVPSRTIRVVSPTFRFVNQMPGNFARPAFGNTFAHPGFGARSFAAPRMGMPMRSFGGSSAMSGGFRSGGGFHGGGFHSGGMHR